MAQKINIGILRRQLEPVEEEFDNDERYEEASQDAISTASELFEQLTTEEKELLSKMKTWAEKAERKPDSKANELLTWLEKNIKPNGEWSRERVVIFTEYRATLNWLQQILASAGYSGDGRLMTLYGGMESEKREAIKAAFQASPDESPVRILLATDAASEGIDLQNHCHRIIHMEIPWN